MSASIRHSPRGPLRSRPTQADFSGVRVGTISVRMNTIRVAAAWSPQYLIDPGVTATTVGVDGSVYGSDYPSSFLFCTYSLGTVIVTVAGSRTTRTVGRAVMLKRAGWVHALVALTAIP